MNKYVAIGILAVIVLLGGGLFFMSNNQGGSQSPEDKAGVGLSPQDESYVETETVTGREDRVISDNGFSTRYIDYSEANLASAAINGNAVVFFHAGWCPSCQAAEKDFKENFDKVPSDITILKADYDKETKLKEKYNIVMQDTFVQVDSEGNEIAKWNSGGEGIKTLLANVQ